MLWTVVHQSACLVCTLLIAWLSRCASFNAGECRRVDPAKNCSNLCRADALVEVIMVDTRPMPVPLLAKFAVINYAWAASFGYRFKYVHVGIREPTILSYWYKVLYLDEYLGRLHVNSKSSPKWLLFLDSDSFVAADMSFPSFLKRLASLYTICDDVAMLVTRSERRSPGWVNSGVLLVQVNSNSRWLFRQWLENGLGAKHLLLNWPGEQGVLIDMLSPGQNPEFQIPQPAPGPAQQLSQRVRRVVTIIDTLEMNSPRGFFVRHMYNREYSTVPMPAHYRYLLRRVRANTVNWTPVKWGPVPMKF